MRWRAGVLAAVCAGAVLGAAAQSVNIQSAAAEFASARQRLAAGEWAVVGDVHVLDRGALGTWDDFGVGSPIVRKEPDAAGRGARYRMWYVGCHLAMREHRCGVGHATSLDGVVWEKHPKPVFVPADLNVQDNLTEIALLKVGARYSLWYSVAADSSAGRRRATVHLATSPDGLVWADEGPVLEGEGLLPLVIEQSVVHDGQRFHLWYVTAINRFDAPVLRHLTSDDGKAWVTVSDTPLSAFQPDMADIGRLSVEAVSGQGFRAWFSLPTHDQRHQSKGLGVMASRDGTTWQWQPQGADPFTTMLERNGDLRIRAVTAVHEPDGSWVWATLMGAHPHDQCIGVAFRKRR